LGKLRVLSGLEVCRIPEQNGFVAVRQRGSHRIMQKQVEATTITVPVPLHRSLRRGTLASIVRRSELARSLFRNGITLIHVNVRFADLYGHLDPGVPSGAYNEL